jgi:hypothetical protein
MSENRGCGLYLFFLFMQLITLAHIIVAGLK